MNTKPTLQQKCLSYMDQFKKPSSIDARWTKQHMDHYLLCHQYLDYQVGRVLDALNNSPFATNTIVIFTSDHGEYGGSHGLFGKGDTAYQEGIRVPLYLYDPTGFWIKKGGQVRTDKPNKAENRKLPEYKFI